MRSTVRSTRLAVIVSGASLALLALGGTALALGTTDAPGPTPGPAATTPATTTPTTTPASLTTPADPTTGAGTGTGTSDPTGSAAPSARGTAPSAAGAEVADVGPDRAAAIALERAGGGRVTGIEREVEHGRLEWKVEIVAAGIEHDIRVDAATGTITRNETDGRDDRSGGGLSGVHGSDDRGSDDRGRDDHGRGTDDGPGHDVGDDHRGDRAGR